MAAEMAEMDGIVVKSVISDDDVAVKDSTFTAGRRGVAGAILNYKITCAKAEQGASIDEVVEIAERVNANTRSMGFGLTSCTTPAKGAPTFEIGGDEMEVGVGLHGEPGRERTKLQSADEIVTYITDACIDDLPFKSGDEVAVMVNGLGGTPLMELYIAYNIVAKILSDKGIKIYRNYINEYCTSIDMAGLSVSFLKLDDEMKELLNYPAEVPYKIF
jgi:dihydroxyacetone kinase-like protein